MLLLITGFRSSQSDLRETITHLFQSIKHDPRAPGYTDPSGTYYKGAENPIWKKPLGKKVLIVDIDTRNPTGENELLNPERIDWETLESKDGGLVSTAMMNHYLYAMIHGYDYKFYHAQEMKDHYNTWISPHVFRELLPDYQFVVAMDADVVVTHLELPLEWLFNRWGIREETSMALPWDTEEIRQGASISTDSKGLRVLNTGLVIAQNSSTTLELLEAWRDCTSETRYKGCSQWKYEWSHEQRAFSEYIRYDFNKTPETIVSLPCDDAVGWPGFREDVLSQSTLDEDVSDCSGTMFRHYTKDKSLVKDTAAASVMQVLSAVIQQNILGHSRQMWYNEPDNTLSPSTLHSAAQEVKKEEIHDLSDLIVERDGLQL